MVSRSVAQSKAWSIVRVSTHIGVSSSSPPKRDRILNATHNYPFSSSSELSITMLLALCRAEIWNCYHPFKHTTCYGSNHRHSHRRRITGSVLISRINNNNSTVHHPLNPPHHHLHRSTMNSSLPIIDTIAVSADTHHHQNQNRSSLEEEESIERNMVLCGVSPLTLMATPTTITTTTTTTTTNSNNGI